LGHGEALSNMKVVGFRPRGGFSNMKAVGFGHWKALSNTGTKHCEGSDGRTTSAMTGKRIMHMRIAGVRPSNIWSGLGDMHRSLKTAWQATPCLTRKRVTA